jgi:hypothetical protein
MYLRLMKSKEMQERNGKETQEKGKCRGGEEKERVGTGGRTGGEERGEKMEGKRMEEKGREGKSKEEK